MKPTDKEPAIENSPSAQTAEPGTSLADAISAVPELSTFATAVELINPHLQSVEERIREQARAFDPAVEGYVSYVCNKGGKRLRPVLALLAGGASGRVGSEHVDLAVIVELIHIATLVHDDIMDGADLRRDQPTANAKWGNALSVLLGDCLFAHALKLAADYGDPSICQKIAKASAEVCSGEIIQTQRRHDLNLSTEDYYRIIEMKTAALFAVACELGAYLSKADRTVIEALRTFGLRIGVAYQIYDDCLDLAGTEKEAGKTLGTDIRKGKYTLPILLMLQSGTEGAKELQDMLVSDNGVDEEALREMLLQSRCVSAAAQVARNMLIEARESLSAAGSNEYLAGLRAITEHLAQLIDRLF